MTDNCDFCILSLNHKLVLCPCVWFIMLLLSILVFPSLNSRVILIVYCYYMYWSYTCFLFIKYKASSGSCWQNSTRRQLTIEFKGKPTHLDKLWIHLSSYSNFSPTWTLYILFIGISYGVASPYVGYLDRLLVQWLLGSREGCFHYT